MKTGRPPIQDEWTNRDDLSSLQKHRLRHPEYYHSEEFKRRHASVQRVWFDHNPDKAKAATEKYAKKVKLLEIKKAQAKQHYLLTKASNRVAKGIRKEILSRHARGKSLANLVVWFNLPASTIQEVITSASLPSNESMPGQPQQEVQGHNESDQHEYPSPHRHRSRGKG